MGICQKYSYLRLSTNTYGRRYTGQPGRLPAGGEESTRFPCGVKLTWIYLRGATGIARLARTERLTWSQGHP